MEHETAFTVSASSIKFGIGVTREVGFDLRQLGVRRAMVVTDVNIRSTTAVDIALEALHGQGIEAVVYDRVRIEPTDISLKDAIAFARQGHFDGYLAVGGGSSIDTAKAANLYATHPADFLEYVNAPIGAGKPIPGPLRPMLAVPTTAGTGSETTGVVIFDYLQMHAKTGIAHRHLRPHTGYVDPDNTKTLPKMVAACTGFDVLVHALESFTTLPYHRRAAPENPGTRPAYQGANPVSDIWSAEAIRMACSNIVRAVEDAGDNEARSQMILAATFAGIGFGNAGLHLAHGMSYPVSGMVKDYIPEGYPSDHPIVPHGMAVVLNAPAVFRFTATADPARHLRAAQLMGVDTAEAGAEEGVALLADTLCELMRRTGMPNGLSAVGYTDQDVERLAAGTLPQHRVTKLSPRPFEVEDLHMLFSAAMRCW